MRFIFCVLFFLLFIDADAGSRSARRASRCAYRCTVAGVHEPVFIHPQSSVLLSCGNEWKKV